MKANKYTVVFIPDNSETNYSFNFSRRALRFWMLLIIIIIVGLGLTGWHYIPVILEQQELQTRYEKLLSERTRVHNLMRDLEQVQHMNNFVRQSLGTEMVIDPETEADSGSAIMLSYSENLPSLLPVDGFVTRDMDKVSVFPHENHYGLDLAIREGEQIKAAASGYVIFSGWTYNMGNYVILYHGDDYFTIYGHNLRNMVEQRTYVKRGDVIALGGNTGISSGPHLHFEIWKDGMAVDPKIFFPELDVKNVSDPTNG